MEIGLNLPVVNPSATPAILREIAQRAEALGFAELYLGEHVVLFDDPADGYPGADDGRAFFASRANLPDPIQTLTWLAGFTDRIRLATGVALIPQRNPVYTAKHVATLDYLSGGRFDFTIGIGWNRDEFAACNVEWDDRAERCREYVEVMKRLWCDPVSQFSGRFYELPACRQHPKPIQQPHPPLWFGGVTEAALVRVADLGTGWYVFDRTPGELAHGRRRLHELSVERSRDPSEVKIILGVWNRLPVSVEVVDEYRRAGCDQFVVSLVGPTVADLFDQLDWFARELVGRDDGELG